MRHVSIIFVTAVLWIGFSSASGGVSITFGGNAGAYTLPREISGYIDGSASTNSHYIWSESGTDKYGNSKQVYKYKHPIPLRTVPNAGMNFGVSFIFPSRIGMYLEGCRTFSILDKEIGNTASDSLPGNDYAYIPHDYRIRITESSDRLYLKSFQFGLGLSYTAPLRDKTRLFVAGGFGRVYYSHYFRVDTKSITTQYYQKNGHLVYSQTDNGGSFDAFGIRYSAYCFKGEVAVERDLLPPLSLRIGLSSPVSYIEKGVHFTEHGDNYSSVYFPLRRFWAGNVSLNAGIRLDVGKGGDR